MARLVITLEVPDVDPSLADPHEIADSVLSSYERDRQANHGPDYPEVVLEGAEWT